MLMLRSMRRRAPWSAGLSLSSTSATDSGTESEYAKVLDQLFRAVKNPSRHVESTSSDDLFAKRSDFFNKVYSEECGLSDAKVVHVAGTKGKGSTVEYIAAGLRAQGHRVGVFTSPHLHTARERIKIGKQLISRNDLTRFGKSALSSMYNHPWTVFFDLLLTTALRYFGEQKVDHLVLETGIGGRYDSTNFLKIVPVGVVTSISLDHQAILGETVAEIAWQKAGIIKPGMHVFTPATQAPEALRVLHEQSAAVGAMLHEVPIDEASLAFLTQDGESLQLHTAYPVQIQNACVAKAVLEHLRAPPVGMRQFFWPCRMETFQVKVSALQPKLPQVERKVTVVLDGCHNGDSVAQFLTGLRACHQESRLLVLFGAGAEKCLDDMLTSLQQGLTRPGDAIMAVQSGHFRSLSEAELVTRLRSRSALAARLCTGVGEPREGTGEKASSVGARLDWAVQDSGKVERGEVVVAVCGSLFAAAEAREWLHGRQPDLFLGDDWVKEPDSRN